MRSFFVYACVATLMLVGNATTLRAQKDAAVRTAGTLEPPRGLFAAQTEPRSITLSWYGGRLPANARVEQYVVCNIGGRDERPRSVGVPPKRGDAEIEPGLQTYVVLVNREVPHRCALERHVPSGDPKVSGTSVQRFPFNEVVPRLTGFVTPGLPANVLATLVSDRQIRLTWERSADATAYHIQRSLGRTGFRTICHLCPNTGVFTDSLPAISSGDKQTGPIDRVAYTVTAVSPGGRSRPAPSNEIRFDKRTGGGLIADTTSSGPLPPGVAFTQVMQGPAPAPEQVTRTTLQENERVVTQIVRIGPIGQVPVHHHPHHNETVIVHAGEVEITIGTQRRLLTAGAVAYVPAGTTMRAVNVSRFNEAQLVAVFSSVGTTGPLMVPGPAN